MATRPRKTSKSKRIRRTPEEARKLILDATKKLIVEHGPDRLGLVSIAKEAGVSHSLVSHYFGSIDGVLEAALTESIAAHRLQIISILPILADAGPQAFIDQFFGLARDPLFTRLTVWAVLSGRVSAADFGPTQLGSGKEFADAFIQHAESKGNPAIDREQLESIIVLTMSAGVGYALAGGAFWRGLGREHDENTDRTVRETLARLIENTIGVD